MVKQENTIEGGLYTIFDQVSDAVFVIDLQGQCVYQNSQSYLFPSKSLKRLIKLCSAEISKEKSPKIDLDNWQVSVSHLADHMVLVCKHQFDQIDQVRVMRQEFMEYLGDNASAQQAAIQALRSYVDWRWISLCSLDHKSKQIIFDLGYDDQELKTALFEPAKPVESFCPCTGLSHFPSPDKLFADPAAFLEQGVSYIIGISIKNHLGDCVGYAILGHDDDPQNAKEAGIFLEAMADLYGPYFEASTAREAAEKAQRESLTDIVTGVGNRRACELFVKECLDEDFRERTKDEIHSMFDPHAMRNSIIMLADFDGFKRLNDTMGHAEGDRALAMLGHCLRQHRSPGNQIFRLGGDEFVQVFPRAGSLESDDLRKWLTSIENSMHEAGFGGLGISIGVVHFFEGDGTYSSLMALADARMYHDKKMRSLYFA